MSVSIYLFPSLIGLQSLDRYSQFVLCVSCALLMTEVAAK